MQAEATEQQPPPTPPPGSTSTHGHKTSPKAKKHRKKKSSPRPLDTETKTASEAMLRSMPDEPESTSPMPITSKHADDPSTVTHPAVTKEEVQSVTDKKAPPRRANLHHQTAILPTPSSTTPQPATPSPDTFTGDTRSDIEVTGRGLEFDKEKKATIHAPSRPALEQGETKANLDLLADTESGPIGRATRQNVKIPSEDLAPIPSRFIVTLVFVVLVIMCVILYVLYSFVSPRKSRFEDYCTTKTCQDAATYLDNVTDTRFNPCLDFYSYVCASWTDKVHSDVGFIRDTRLSLWKTVNHTLHGIPVIRSRYGTHLLQAFYKSCYNFMGKSLKEPVHLAFERRFGPVQDFIEKSYADLLVNLTLISLTHGIDSVFGVRFIQEGGRAKLYIIRSCSVLQKLSDDGKRMIDGYLLELLQKISRSTFDVMSYHQKVISLDNEIHVIFSVPEPIQDMVLQDLHTLTKHISVQTWLGLFNDIVQRDEKFQNDSRIKFKGFNSTRRVLALLEEKADHKLRALYLYVQLAAELLRLDFRRRFTTSNIDVIHACLAESQKVLTHTWSYVYASFSNLPSVDASLEALYTRVSDAVVNLDYLDWMDQMTQLITMRMIDNVSLTTFPAAFSYVFPFETPYANITMPDVDFITDYIDLLAMEQTYLHRFPQRVEQAQLNRLQLDGSIEYSQLLNSVVVPAVYGLPPIFYGSRAPLHFDVATVGVLMIVELSRALGPSEGETFWSNATRKSFDESFRCLMNVYEEMSRTNKTNQKELVDAVFTWTRSLRLAYDVVKAQGVPQGYLLQDVDRAFFKRFCLLSCTSSQKPQPLTPRQRCMLPVMNMPEFFEAFECPESVVSRARQCKIL
ncbi:neprilysin-1-like isoform X2 [Ornithodoros turicata]|uniref:neprilysin-1-like isoform X2 n=1 Tax=Ornithodoros turicata TaxID=34597 RepID=UPI00313A119C